MAEPSVDRKVPTPATSPRALLLTYPGTITLSERTLTFLTGLLQAHRARPCTWRKLPASDQALLVLAHLRNGDTYQRLAVGFGVGVASFTATSGRPSPCWPHWVAA